MSLPRSSLAYPSQLLDAVSLAATRGELVIPTPKPSALRLQLQGLRGALRREGKAEIIDSVGFYIQSNPSALVIRLKENTELALDVSAALAAAQSNNPPVSATEQAEAAISRLFG